MRRRTLAVLTCWLAAGLLSAGCSSGAPDGPVTVFAMSGGFSQGGPAATIDIVDIGVPGTQNVTGHSVRVEGVRLVSLPSSVHLRSVTAYAPGPGVGVVFGNLLARCREIDMPYPVTADVTPAHAAQNWNLVIAISFTRPGRYDLHHVKLYYLTDGHRGWQYQNLNTTMIISVPRKGEKPQFTGC
jgi:hypothetical protein